MKFLARHKLLVILITGAFILAGSAIAYALQSVQDKPTARERQCADEARLTSEISPDCALVPTQ